MAASCSRRRCAIHRDRITRRARRYRSECARAHRERLRHVGGRLCRDAACARAPVRAMDRRLAGLDALVMPTRRSSRRHRRSGRPEMFAARNSMLLRNTSIGNFFDLCGISLPLPAPLAGRADAACAQRPDIRCCAWPPASRRCSRGRRRPRRVLGPKREMRSERVPRAVHDDRQSRDPRAQRRQRKRVAEPLVAFRTRWRLPIGERCGHGAGRVRFRPSAQRCRHSDQLNLRSMRTVTGGRA